MKFLNHIIRTSTAVLIVVVFLSSTNSVNARPNRSWEYKSFELADGRSLTYMIVEPDAIDRKKAYTTLLVFSSKTQTADQIHFSFNNYWAKEAKERGWVVISPVMPQGGFYSGTLLKELLDYLSTKHRVKDKKFHLTGNSFGGLTCFKVALKYPQYFKSITVLAGFTPYLDQLDKIKDIPINLFVGGFDYTWQGPMRIMKYKLESLGATVTWNIVPDDEHDLKSLQNNPVVFDAIQPFVK